jgi:hypothetical protein
MPSYKFQIVVYVNAASSILTNEMCMGIVNDQTINRNPYMGHMSNPPIAHLYWVGTDSRCLTSDASGDVLRASNKRLANWIKRHIEIIYATPIDYITVEINIKSADGKEEGKSWFTRSDSLAVIEDKNKSRSM